VQRNLAYVDPKHIPGLQAELEVLANRKADLQQQVKQRPKESDINEMVLGVLKKLFWLGSLKLDRLKPVLRELSHITVFTQRRGKGSGTRYQFERGEVHMAVGGVTGKLNPQHP
jgi:hypothetical protein